MRALVTCCTALTGCPFKSYESQKIESSQRFICHGGGAGVAVERLCVGNRAGWEAGGSITTSQLKSVESVRELWLALVERVALGTGRL